MLSVASAPHLQRALAQRGVIKAPEVRRSYTSRGNPKRKSAPQQADTEWLAHVGGMVAPRDTIPLSDDSPLPRKFNAQGYIKPEPIAAPAKPKKRVSKLKKKMKKMLIPDFNDPNLFNMGMTDGSSQDALMRDEMAMREMFGHTGGRTPTGSYEEAAMGSKKVEQTHKVNREKRAEQESNPFAHMFEQPEDYKDKPSDEELIADDKAQMEWLRNTMRSARKGFLEEHMAAKKAQAEAAGETYTEPKKVTKKIKKVKKLVKKGSSSTSTSTKSTSTDSAEAFTSTDGSQAAPKPKKRFTVSPLTFMEGSPEDLELFGRRTPDGVLIEEDGAETNVEDASASGTRMKPRLARKMNFSSMRKSYTEGLPTSEADAEAYLEQVQEADNKATQAYIDNYDQDQMMRPPIATYTYYGMLQDEIGVSRASVDSMGTWLSLKSRGIRFEGSDSLTWSVRDYLVSQEVANVKFKFHEPPYAKADIEVTHTGKIPMLDKFKLNFDIPVKLASTNPTDANAPPIMEEAVIQVVSSHKTDLDTFAISLKMPDGNVIYPQALSVDPQGYPSTFDEQIKQIQHQLPAKTYLKSCWNCAFSEYNPIAKSTFGGLACFRQWPGITSVRDKVELLRNWSKHLERVQETHHCETFKRRTKPRIAPFNTTLPSIPAGLKHRKAEQEERKEREL